MFGLFRRSTSRPNSIVLNVEPLEDRSVPATFQVTTLTDAGAGSLRQAVINANNRLGRDLITFAPGLSGIIPLTTADLDITDDVLIQGPGANVLTVSGQNNFRVFDINPNNASVVNVRISGLKLTKGRAKGGGNQDGGAIRVGDNLVTVSGCVVSGNKAVGDGGAISVAGGSLTAINTIFANNGANGNGGALYINGVNLNVRKCQFLNNSAVDGGAIYGDGNGLLRDCTLSGNTAFGEGGGLEWNGGAITIKRCTVSDNSAYYGGGVSVDGGRLTVRDSTISGNVCTDDMNLGGAGLLLQQIETLIVNSTISGNLDQTTNPTPDTGGGGIHIRGGNTVIRNSTIAFNETTGTGGGIFLQDFGGVVARLLLASTIVSDSTAPGGNFDVARDAGEGKASTVNSLIENAQPLFVNNGNTASIFDVDPLLEPLANNGGPTQTHALDALSQAIDAGSNPDALKFDQRGNGFLRVTGDGIDIGSFEL